MVRFPERLYELRSEHPLKRIIWPGGHLFPTPGESDVLISDGWLTPFSDIRLRRLAIPSLEEISSARTWDSVRAVAFTHDHSLVAGCIFRKRAHVLTRTTLEEVARIDGLGEGLDCLAFTPSGEFLVVGGDLHETIKVIDTGSWKIVKKRRIGHTSSMVMGPDSNQVIAFHGPTGRVAWFDCVSGTVEHEIKVPPFRQVAQVDHSLFLSSGFAEPISSVPRDKAQYFADKASYRPADFESWSPGITNKERDLLHRGLHKIPGYVPILGMEMVQVVAEIAVVDSISRQMKGHQLIRPLPARRVEIMQRSHSGQRLHLFSPGIVRTLRSNDLTIESDWLFPEQLRPLAVLEEGRSAIVVDPPRATGESGQRIMIISRPSG